MKIKMTCKIGMISLGCSKNQIDAERMLYKIKENGYEFADTIDKSDIVIVNTCGFINSAKSEAIENILELATHKNDKTIKGIIVTGCLAERYKSEIIKEIPEVDAILGTGSYDEIITAIEKVLKNEKFESYNDKNLCQFNSKRIVTTPSYLAYIKIAEGCDNHCTYCTIPQIRGKFRSRTIEDIISEASELASQGVRELYVVAQDTTRYGIDIYGKYMLPELLRELCRIDGFEWIKVLYLYPEKITDELIDVIAENKKIAKYIEMPIQHISNKILKAMGRHGTSEKICSVIEKLRNKIPDVAIRTTLITGFPGETQKDFEELYSFVKKYKLDGIGIFPYSREENTKAFDMPMQIDEQTKLERTDKIMTLQQSIVDENNQKYIGQTIKVLVCGFDKYAEVYFARSEKQADDIDGKIFIQTEKSLKSGEFYDVVITDTLDYDLLATI